jgi:hypothetical protein
LDLSECENLGDAGLEALQAFPKLRYLNLSGVKLTDRSLQQVSYLMHLIDLSLNGCDEVTDEGLAHIAMLGELQFVVFSSYPRSANVVLIWL